MAERSSSIEPGSSTGRADVAAEAETALTRGLMQRGGLGQAAALRPARHVRHPGGVPPAYTRAMACRVCGSSLPDDARFCPQCGAPVTASAAPAPSSPSLGTRYERRVLTVLFGDLVGFTATSDGADPEDVRARVRPFHALVRRGVAATGGTIARVVGDGVMAVWGYPIAHEDDALRAIRSALAIVDGLPALGDDLHARLGINTGEAVVAFGSDDEDADDAMGDAVNVAARLATTAPVDGIVIGEVTRRLAGDAVVAERLSPLSLKGKTEPVAAFALAGLAVARAEPRRGPFVGRTDELAILAGGFERAFAERRVVRAVVVGEPGIGKSRLLVELHHQIRATGQAVRWLVGRCRPDGGSPAWALGQIVKVWADIADDDDPATVRARLEATLPASLTDRDWIRDRLGLLVGLETRGAVTADELVAAWTRFFGVVAAERPTVAVIEDAHWADAELTRFLTGPVLRDLGAPLLVVITARPEALDAQPGLAAVELPPLHLAVLPADDAEALVVAVGAGLELSTTERAAIVARGGGNPLFTAELVRLIAGHDPSAGDRTHGLPETVQAVIAARLDRLDALTRDIARDAAVIGSPFWRGALVALDPAVAPELDARLVALVRAQLILVVAESSLPDDREYVFRHALVRDVAYGQLTRGARATRHAAAAAWLAGIARGGPGELAAIVADHDLAALELGAAVGDAIDAAAVTEHAVVHLLAAGEHAAPIDALAAAARYRQALTLLVPDDPRRVDALASLATAQIDHAEVRDALVTAEDGIARSHAAGDIEHEGQFHLLASRAGQPLADPDWIQHARRAVEILETRPAGPALLAAFEYQTFVELKSGTGPDLIRWANRSLELARTLGLPVPDAVLGRRGFFRAMYGERGGLDDLTRAVDAARIADRSADLATAIKDLGGGHRFLGERAAAEERFLECAEFAAARGLREIEAMGLTDLAGMIGAAGHWDEALETLDSAAAIVASTQIRAWPLVIEARRCLLLEERGEFAAVDGIMGRMEGPIDDLGPRDADYIGCARFLRESRSADPATIRDAFRYVWLQDEPDDLNGMSVADYLLVARAAIAGGAPELVARIVETVGLLSPLGAAVRASLRAYHAAGVGDHERAVPALVGAAATWDSFGYRPEAAHARQWAAASLIALGRLAEAIRLLDGDRPLWVELRATPALERSDRLLAAASAASTAPAG